jgi:glucose uptake protein
LIWKEFKGAPKVAHQLNTAMFILFVAGLALIIRAGA